MATKTQGTYIYYIDANENLVTVGCPINPSFSGRSTSQIETTCITDIDRTYTDGLKDPGTFDFSIRFDADESSHAALQALQEAGTTVWWAIGLADGTAAPTVDTGGTFDLATSRSWRRFQGFVVSYGESYAENSVVEGTVSVQISGAIEYKSAV